MFSWVRNSNFLDKLNILTFNFDHQKYVDEMIDEIEIGNTVEWFSLTSLLLISSYANPLSLPLNYVVSAELLIYWWVGGLSNISSHPSGSLKLSEISLLHTRLTNALMLFSLRLDNIRSKRTVWFVHLCEFCQYFIGICLKIKIRRKGCWTRNK